MIDMVEYIKYCLVLLIYHNLIGLLLVDIKLFPIIYYYKNDILLKSKHSFYTHANKSVGWNAGSNLYTFVILTDIDCLHHRGCKNFHFHPLCMKVCFPTDSSTKHVVRWLLVLEYNL